jgi:hypothetical protein
MKYVTLLLLALNLAGCGLVARKGYGAKKQKIENEQTITKWMGKKGFATEHIVSIPPKDYLEFFFGLPQAPLLFDNQTGNLLAIGFSNGKYCPKDVDKSFSAVLPYQLLKEKPDSLLISEVTTMPPGTSLKDTDKYEKIKDTLKLILPEIEEKVMTLGGEPVKRLAYSGDDYTLILPFALFLGEKLQLKDLKKFYISAITNRFAKIKVVFLNLDKQEWWGEEWNKKNNIHF